MCEASVTAKCDFPLNGTTTSSWARATGLFPNEVPAHLLKADHLLRNSFYENLG